MAASFDYIIVGAGSAGCVLANRLTADPGVTVLLLEAGGSDRSFWLDVPLGVGRILGDPRYDWRFESQPEPELDGRRIRLPRGRTLGGTSAINGFLYVRGHASDYDAWASAGNGGWSWDDVLPYFRRSEDHHRGASTLHGAGGELAANDPGQRWQVLDAYLDAAAEAGVPRADDLNDGRGRAGAAYAEMTIAGGRRCSTANAFLRPVMNRPNLAVATGAVAGRVTFDGRRATGVAYRANGATVTAEARREVILSAGTFGSPQLLQLSGLGPADLLRRHGVAVLADMAGVGRNLQDHWMVRSQHRVYGTRTLNNWLQNPLRKLAMGAQYLLTRGGPMSAPPLLLTMYAKSAAEVADADLRIHVSIASYARVGGPIDPFPGITSSACICRPTSRGTVEIASADPLAAPEIRNNYLSSEADRRLAVAGLRAVRRIVASPALARFRPEAIRPEAGLTTDDELLDFARSIATTEFHPVGTCAMGDVVDDRLRVRGCEGLRVVDGSVMPTIISGGTNAPIIMIAEKAADLIREDRG